MLEPAMRDTIEIYEYGETVSRSCRVTVRACPFCSSLENCVSDVEVQGRGSDRFVAVHCAGCGCQGPWKAEPEAEAVKAWNGEPELEMRTPWKSFEHGPITADSPVL